MREAAAEIGLDPPPILRTYSNAVEETQCFARRAVNEEYLGLEDQAPDHDQWIDYAFIIAALMCLVVVRFLGLGPNSKTLYLVGGTNRCWCDSATPVQSSP